MYDEPLDGIKEMNKNVRARQKALKSWSPPLSRREKTKTALIISGILTAITAYASYSVFGPRWVQEREQREYERKRAEEEKMYAKQVRENEFVKFIGQKAIIINMEGNDWRMSRTPGTIVDEYTDLIVISREGKTFVYSKDKPPNVNSGYLVSEYISDGHKETYRKYCEAVRKHTREVKALCSSYGKNCLNRRFANYNAYQTCESARSFFGQPANDKFQKKLHRIQMR